MGYKGPLAYVKPSEFRDRTSVWGRRLGAISKVDAAYDKFWANATALDNIKGLHDALTGYLAEKGGYWEKVDRDKESGGLLRWLHGETGAVLLKLVGPTNDSAQFRAKTALMNTDIPHSRFGVLYLFGNIDISLDHLSIGLEGVSAIGGAIGHGVSANYHQLGNLQGSQQSFDMGEIKGLRAGDFSGNLAAPFNIANKAAATTGTRNTSDRHFATQPSDGLNADGTPRVFDVVRVAPRVAQPLPGFPVTLKALEVLQVSNIDRMSASLIGGATLLATGALDILNNVRVAMTNLAKDFIDWLKNKLLARVTWGWEVSGLLISKLVKFVVGKCVEAAVPFVGAGMDLAGGLAKTVKAAKERIEAYLLRRQIMLNPGHPELAANSIESAMNTGMLLGLWSALKGAAQVALSVFLPGAGSLVAALVTGLEWLVKFVYRLWEQSNIRQFLATARDWYSKECGLARRVETEGYLPDPSRAGERIKTVHARFEPELDPGKGGFIHKLEEFKAFYQKGCDASPIIPMLTLNSGICGSLMVMLRMVDDTETATSSSDRSVISQKQFDAGNAYFQHLKAYGRTYLESSGFQFRAANGSESIQGYLNHAIHHHTKPYSIADKALAFGSGMAT